jgi:hypothetical protein
MSAGEAVASLRYGDRIFIEFVDFAGEGHIDENSKLASSKKRKNGKSTWLIEGQGFFNDELAVVNCPPPSADDCLFQICPRSRVSAAEDFALQCKHRDEIRDKAVKGGWNDELQNQFESAKKHADSEEAENDKAMQERAGIEVAFGEITQLKHCKTGKWLMVDKNKTASVEQENIECTLSEKVSQQCWITIRPSKRFQFQGDEVCDKSIVYLCSENSKTSQAQFLHMARHHFVDSNALKSEAVKERSQSVIKMELNSSLDATPWRIVRYDANAGGSITSAAADEIQLGDVLCVEATDTPGGEGALDSSKTSYLGYYHWAERTPQEIALANGGGGSGVHGAGGASTVVMPEQQGQEGRKLLFKPKSPELEDDVYSSDCYWIVESTPRNRGGSMEGLVELPEGGPVRWSGAAIRLRHVNTGMVLVQQAPKATETGSSGELEISLTVAKDWVENNNHNNNQSNGGGTNSTQEEREGEGGGGKDSRDGESVSVEDAASRLSYFKLVELSLSADRYSLQQCLYSICHVPYSYHISVFGKHDLPSTRSLQCTLLHSCQYSHYQYPLPVVSSVLYYIPASTLTFSTPQAGVPEGRPRTADPDSPCVQRQRC